MSIRAGFDKAANTVAIFSLSGLLVLLVSSGEEQQAIRFSYHRNITMNVTSPAPCGKSRYTFNPFFQVF